MYLNVNYVFLKEMGSQSLVQDNMNSRSICHHICFNLHPVLAILKGCYKLIPIKWDLVRTYAIEREARKS